MLSISGKEPVFLDQGPFHSRSRGLDISTDGHGAGDRNTESAVVARLSNQRRDLMSCNPMQHVPDRLFQVERL